MKSLLCFIAIVASTTIEAQNTPLLRKAPKIDQPVSQVPEWLDTTNTHHSRYGKIVRLRQDNMPCVIPYSGGKILNAYFPKSNNSRMPNLWKRDSASRK